MFVIKVSRLGSEGATITFTHINPLTRTLQIKLNVNFILEFVFCHRSEYTRAHTHTHARTHARTHTHTHTHTHTNTHTQTLPLCNVLRTVLQHSSNNNNNNKLFINQQTIDFSTAIV